uniref:Cct motif-containing protein n=1 Tax=Tetraselmis sp. GSL018 TaxID=582737 RepID=A0A061QT02_9CHLO|mmetsp:Transcript_8567/g.20583  ORF Transcript_8567/g.20583 Transcript_8567/m.20583 type:complete len:354 (+) Transcript_8567:1215-2276(+)
MIVTGSLDDGFDGLGFSSNEIFHGDFKDILFDDTDFGLGTSQARSKEIFDLLDSTISTSDEYNPDEADSHKEMFLGLNAEPARTSLRRSAFSMGDLQMLHRSPVRDTSSQVRGISPTLETVPEGSAAPSSCVPVSLSRMYQQQPFQMPLTVGPQSSGAAAAEIRAGNHDDITSLSIEEIEAQLQRTRQMAIGGGAGASTAPMAAQAAISSPQARGLYSISPMASQQYAQSFAQAGQPSSSAAPMLPAPACVDSSGIRRSKSAAELSRLPLTDGSSFPGRKEEAGEAVVYIGKLTPEERRLKILRYREKRNARNFQKKIKYVCRKTLADSRPRIRGRFARNTDEDAKMPGEKKN